MPGEIPFPLAFLHQRLESGHVLSEALFVPELGRLGANREQARQALRNLIPEHLAGIPTLELHRRRLATESRGYWVTVELPPPRQQIAWAEPVRLRFPIVVWSHGTDAVLARVPTLQIEVIARTEQDLRRLVRQEILAALRRDGSANSLYRLCWMQRAERFQIDWEQVPVAIPSLKQRGQRAANSLQEENPSVLREVATPSTGRTTPAFEVEAEVKRLAEWLTAARPSSVLLVGPSGVGKTAILEELIRRREEFQLSATPFHRTSGARIVAGQCGFGMWQERCSRLVKEAAHLRAVVHLGNLVELMEVGKSELNQTGLAGFLRPAIARGELLCVAECTPEQLPAIEREDPQLIDVFQQVRVEEPDPPRGRRILEQVAQAASPSGPVFPVEVLDAIDRLHRRYATYSAFPGRPIRFLENLRRDCAGQPAIRVEDVLQAFTRETGLPAVLLDPRLPMDVDATRRWFEERVVGQEEACTLVVDTLATVKAGMTRPSRPITSLLFIGPTGVGKTELAKTLAEFLFGSRERLTRFDMSEFSDPVSVQRLVGTAFGTEGLLTARVREQPFSVLLLDEFEKAHPMLFDLLLQVLGEARLTDAAGRLADFRNTVVVLTSNLGAESYQAGHPGLRPSGPDAASARDHFVREVERFLRPELFNRIDRLVPFSPLGEASIEQIARRELDKVCRRDGIRFRGASLDAGPEVVAHLARAGFDARYGARPLKRAIEREILAPLAHQMNRYSAELSLDVCVELRGGTLAATVRPKAEQPRRSSDAGLSGPEVEACQAWTRLRRFHQALERSSVLRRLENDLFQLQQVEKRVIARQRRGKPVSDADYAALARLARWQTLLAEVARQREAATLGEEQALLAFHADGKLPASGGDELSRLWEDADRLLLDVHRLTKEGEARLVVALFSEDRDRLYALGDAYLRLAQNHGIQGQALQYLVASGGEAPRDVKIPPRPADREESLRMWQKDYLVELPDGEPMRLSLKRDLLDVPLDRGELGSSTIGLGLYFLGAEAELIFGGESGLHVFKSADGQSSEVLVQLEAGRVDDYLPPERIERRGGIAGPVRRTYDVRRKRIVEERRDASVFWDGDLLPPLDRLTAGNMRQSLMDLLLD